MNDLNQHQVILLCLLVSFVTSIGTGIITSTLLSEAPQNVTQTINRVVERTVEKVVPTPIGSAREPSSTKEVTTVVVKEDDQVVAAISANQSGLVRIVKNLTKDSLGKSTSFVQSLGAIVKSDGTIIADKQFVTGSGTYFAIPFSGGDPYPVTVMKDSTQTNVVFMAPIVRADAPAKTYATVKLGSSDSVQLGQAVVVIGGRDKQAVSIGHIVSVNSVDVPNPSATSTSSTGNSGNSTTTPSTVKMIQTIEIDTPLHDGIPGSVLVTLNGTLVGFENMDLRNGNEFNYSAINYVRRTDPSFF